MKVRITVNAVKEPAAQELAYLETMTGTALLVHLKQAEAELRRLLYRELGGPQILDVNVTLDDDQEPKKGCLPGESEAELRDRMAAQALRDGKVDVRDYMVQMGTDQAYGQCIMETAKAAGIPYLQALDAVVGHSASCRKPGCVICRK